MGRRGYPEIVTNDDMGGGCYPEIATDGDIGGEGGPKITIFAVTSFLNGPYLKPSQHLR